MADPVWFWQRIVSPHMVGLAAALAAAGRDVTYVAEKEMSVDRAAQGWKVPAVGTVHLRFAATAISVHDLVQTAPPNSIHICQGFRGNGLIDLARRKLAARRLRQWVIMETVDDFGWRGILKRIEYCRLIRKWRGSIQGVLATGHATPAWLAKRGMETARVFPFAYFLPESPRDTGRFRDPCLPFRFLFVGRIIGLKRIDSLLDALARLKQVEFELTLVGSGPLEESLRKSADEKLRGRVKWLGQRSIDEIPALMTEADCLVLPSRHDGWGAVVSEALMAGTPAICSDACGSADAVRASGVGGIFPAGNIGALVELLRDAISRGPQTPSRRAELMAWARRLGATSGAAYLDAILRSMENGGPRPLPPWRRIDGVNSPCDEGISWR